MYSDTVFWYAPIINFISIYIKYIVHSQFTQVLHDIFSIAINTISPAIYITLIELFVISWVVGFLVHVSATPAAIILFLLSTLRCCSSFYSLPLILRHCCPGNELFWGNRCLIWVLLWRGMENEHSLCLTWFIMIFGYNGFVIMGLMSILLMKKALKQSKWFISLIVNSLAFI
jgi:hypothetical protein